MRPQPAAAGLEIRARAVSESALQATVLDLAVLLKWRRCHFRAARTDHGWRTPVEGDAGFPDMVLAGHGRLVVAELKTQAGRLAPEQARWLDLLAAGPAETYLWRPADLLSGRIRAVLDPGYDPAVGQVPQWTPRGTPRGRRAG